MGIPPNGRRVAKYKVPANELTGTGPYKVNVKFITQMVPVNLIPEIAGVGFDYNLSPREVAKRVVHGHRMSLRRRTPADVVEHRPSGTGPCCWTAHAAIWNLHPTEKDIMQVPEGPFPYDPKFNEKQSEGNGLGGGGGLIIPIEEPPLPEAEQAPLDFTEEQFGEESFGEENFGDEPATEMPAPAPEEKPAVEEEPPAKITPDAPDNAPPAVENKTEQEISKEVSLND